MYRLDGDEKAELQLVLPGTRLGCEKNNFWSLIEICFPNVPTDVLHSKRNTDLSKLEMRVSEISMV